MERRTFLGVIAGGLLAAPLVSTAQQYKAGMPRVGVLAPGRPPNVAVEAFRSGLRDLGYVEDQNILLEWRWDEHRPDRYAAMASDLVQRNVDLIVAGTTGASIAAKNATPTIPIVMAASGLGDPVELGLVQSLARPGGNVTGLVLLTNELPGKRFELLKEAIPRLTRVALLWNRTPLAPTLVKEHEAAARALAIQIQLLEVRGPDDFGGAFQAATQERAQGLIMIQGPLYFSHRVQIATLALNSRLPTISGETHYAQAGGLMLASRSALREAQSRPKPLISERPIGDALWVNLTATYRTQFSDGFQNSRRTRPATALTGDYHGSGTPIALRVAPDASWISRTGILYQCMPAQIIHRRRLLTAADGR